ncbi:hypothetical protein ACQ86N_25835 [Puia sp. P3]|uniref:hypothetical protein n=1 Tax=Puia sp. P3 TaxID=3423952 RepID=UPI003D66E304
MLDDAVLEHEDLESTLKIKESFKKIDEIPFDFERKKMSVVMEDNEGRHILICKGAVEGMLDSCSRMDLDGNITPS